MRLFVCVLGKNPLLRIWDFSTTACIAFLHAHTSDVCSLAFAHHSKLVAAVGKDQQSRQMVAIWDITAIGDGGKALLVHTVLVDFHVRTFKFAPFDDEKMVSVGNESIRFWRLKARRH